MVTIMIQLVDSNCVQVCCDTTAEFYFSYRVGSYLTKLIIIDDKKSQEARKMCKSLLRQLIECFPFPRSKLQSQLDKCTAA